MKESDGFIERVEREDPGENRERELEEARRGISVCRVEIHPTKMNSKGHSNEMEQYLPSCMR